MTPFEQYPHNPTVDSTVVHRMASDTFPPAASVPLLEYISVSMNTFIRVTAGMNGVEKVATTMRTADSVIDTGSSTRKT